jgi:hypothetical protein
VRWATCRWAIAYSSNLVVLHSGSSARFFAVPGGKPVVVKGVAEVDHFGRLERRVMVRPWVANYDVAQLDVGVYNGLPSWCLWKIRISCVALITGRAIGSDGLASEHGVFSLSQSSEDYPEQRLRKLPRQTLSVPA